MNRIFYSSNGTLTDYTYQLKDYRSGSMSFTLIAAQDAIYIGHELPFNSFYLKVATANTNASVMSIQYWDSSSWYDVIETIDETSSSGKSLAQSGYITFVPNKAKSWVKESTNYSGESIDDLETINVYDMYWIKITFSANLSASVVLNWFGQKFCNDNDLLSEYPDLVRDDLLDAWETGKTSWEEQEIVASEITTNDLITKGLITDKAQILDRYEMIRVSIPKVASIILNGMGKDYIDSAIAANNEYTKRVNSWYPKHIDFFNQGRIDFNAKVQYGKLIR